MKTCCPPPEYLIAYSCRTVCGNQSADTTPSREDTHTNSNEKLARRSKSTSLGNDRGPAARHFIRLTITPPPLVETSLAIDITLNVLQGNRRHFRAMVKRMV